MSPPLALTIVDYQFIDMPLILIFIRIFINLITMSITCYATVREFTNHPFPIPQCIFDVYHCIAGIANCRTPPTVVHSVIVADDVEY